MRKKIVKKAPNEPVLAARVPDHQEVAPVQAEGLREGVQENDHYDDHVPVDLPDNTPIDVIDDQVPPVQVETVAEDPEPAVGSTRSRSNVKPNPKYSPEVYDLSYVGIKSRTRNRKSIRRAVN